MCAVVCVCAVAGLIGDLLAGGFVIGCLVGRLMG